METDSNGHPQFQHRNPILISLLHKSRRDKKEIHKSAMERFKAAIIRFGHSNPSLFGGYGGNSYQRLIEQRFSQFFPDFQTPDHPPYAAMIHRAIWDLNEKGGSSEDSISNYIKREYNDLPWAHSTLLKHHLEKLVDRQELSLTGPQRYSLPGEDTDPIPVNKSSKLYKKRKKLKRKNQKKCRKEEPHKQIIQELQEQHQEQDQEQVLMNESRVPQYQLIKNEKYDEGNTLVDIFVQEEVKKDTEVNEKKKGKLKRDKDLKPERSSKRIKKQKIASNEDTNIQIHKEDEERTQLDKQVSTTSQLKITLKKDGSTRTYGQRSKLRSWKKPRSPSLESPLNELLDPLSKNESESCDLKAIDVPKSKQKGRGRPPKPQEIKKSEALLISKRARGRPCKSK